MNSSFRLLVVDRKTHRLLFSTQTSLKKFSLFTDLFVLSCIDDIKRLSRTSPSAFIVNAARTDPWSLSAFVGPTDKIFIVLHQTRHEESIKLFLQETYETYAKLALNPFFDPEQSIVSADFTEKVELLARKFILK